MLHKDYDRKGSVLKIISDHESQGALGKDEHIGGKPPVVKLTLNFEWLVESVQSVKSCCYEAVG
jgi:hypothetical protein